MIDIGLVKNFSDEGKRSLLYAIIADEVQNIGMGQEEIDGAKALMRWWFTPEECEELGVNAWKPLKD